jgi:hypothetical protein
MSFWRGDTANFMPWRRDMAKPSAIADFILKGWMPEEPFIDRDTNIVAFGSCFAGNVGRYLADLGFDVATQRPGRTHIQTVGDGLVNVHAICQQFKWAWENRVPTVELWHGWKAEDYGYDEDVRLATRELFDRADVFILTFGLSEIWYDEPTGQVFWRAVPRDKFDPLRHKFRVATYEETIDRLRRIRSLIRTHRPSARIIFTLSPIGIAATFRPVSCITANEVSKALLRAAIDDLYREVHADDPDFYYFPSYEVVKHGLRVPFDEDLRHVGRHALQCNMKAFERYFCRTGVTDEDLHGTIREALEFDEVLQSVDDDTREQLVLGQKLELIAATSPSLGKVEKEVKRRKFIEERLLRTEELKAAREARLLRIKQREERIVRREQVLRERRQRLEEKKRKTAGKQISEPKGTPPITES